MNARRYAFGLAGALFLGCGAGSATGWPVGGALAAQEAGSMKALVVVGLGGTDEYREAFHAHALALYSALTARHGLSPEDVILLTEREELAPGASSGRATKDELTAALGRLAGEAGGEDRLLVVLIGHGTARGDEARFNLPGPDLTPTELAAGLAAFPGRVAVVHTGSASGGFVEALSGPGRIVVAATRTARERNATEFPRYFVEAVTGNGADLDKDGAISLLEAFQYARAEVARFYEEENEILTEHAVLDDNGDGSGSTEVGGDGQDGALAGRFLLGSPRLAAAPATDDPVLARLYRERQEIQARIDALRAARDTLEAAAYDARLEELLVELALKNREIRAREGGGS